MKLKKYIYLLGITTMTLTTACEEQSELVTSANYERLFAPINLTTRVTNQVNVEFKWTPVQGATGYNLEIYQNANQSTEEEEEEDDSKVLSYDGTPVITKTGIKNTEIPYMVRNLESETKFTARIQAVGENIGDSNWSGIEFKTNAEQIFLALGEDDVTATEVTLRWPAGEVASKIVLTPGNIEHPISETEIAAGAATISNLTPETTYTAKLVKANGKTRGIITFETLIDLDGAKALYPEDDWVSILEEAESGTVFALFPGEYKAPVVDGNISKIVIDKNLEFKAVRPYERPIIYTCFQLEKGASLSMKQIIMDGSGTDGSQAFDYKEAIPYGALTLDDCEIRNFVKGVCYINVAAEIESVSFNNCLIHNIDCDGGDLFDCRKGYIKAFNLTNSTIWNSCKERDFIRYDDVSGSFTGATPTIHIDHCTIDGICSGTRRIFYVRFKGNSITFTNNMVSNMPNCKRGFSDSSNTSTPIFDNNNYYNTINLTKLGESDKTLKIFDTEGSELNPGYKDIDNGDFTLSNEDLIFNQVGDPRWY